MGSSLAPALEASTQEQFIEAVARMYATVQCTDFPARAEAIADEIQAKEFLAGPGYSAAAPPARVASKPN